MEVAPKKLFRARGGIVMAALSGRQEAQPHFLATPSLVQKAPQGIADQDRNGKLFALGQEAQLAIRGFFQKECCPFHMTYDAIYASRRSM